MTEPLPNPLLEAKADSLAELMARDPLSLTRKDRDELVAEMRRMREKWAKAEAEGKTKAPRATKAAAKEVMKIEDLDLDL